MKRCLLFVILAIFSVACQKIEDIVKKDDDICAKMEDIVFMQFCYDNFDVNDDGKVSKSEAEAVSVIDMSSKSKSDYDDLKSLKGIEYFTNLKELYCSHRNVVHVDVSKNKKLEIIGLGDTNITELDVSRCTNLRELYLWETKLTELDLSKNTQLECLDIHYSKIKRLDITNNNKLEEIDYYGSDVIIIKNGKAIATKIELTHDSLLLDEGETLDLDLTVYPTEAAQYLTWSSEDNNVAEVINGKLTAKGKGETTIYVKSEIATATCRVIVRPAVESVIVNETSLNLQIGEVGDLFVTITPQGANGYCYVYSNNPSVAYPYRSEYNTSLHRIQIIPKSPGTAIITIKTVSGNKTAKVNITVKEKSVPISGFSLSPSSLSLTIGQTSKLTTTITPSNATESILWTSSNTAIASVDSEGNVTAVSSGSATITAKTSNSGVTRTCRITVKDANVAVSGINLDKSSMSLTVGASGTLSATITPSNASNKGVTWTSSNSSVASVSSSGVVTAKSVGTTTITARSSDGGKTATCKVSVTNTTIAITGISLDKT